MHKNQNKILIAFEINQMFHKKSFQGEFEIKETKVSICL